jgi:peptidoglycan glycosyltransferase
MALSPLKTPVYRRGQRRSRGPGFAGALFAILGLLLVGWLAWRFGFGLPAKLVRLQNLARSGGAQEALARLQALQQSRPEHPLVLDTLGLALNRLKRPKEAQDAYERSRDAGLGRGAAALHVQEGKAALARGACEEAGIEFEHAASLDKRSALAQVGLGHVALCRGRAHQALEFYQAALALKPGLKEAESGRTKAGEIVERGSLYYFYDRHGEPLARQVVAPDGLGARSYPQAQNTAHVIGYLSERAGPAGLERDLAGLFPGCEVELTLDVRLQQAASKALGWRKGALVALDPATGEILAALSQPSFRPDRVDKDWHSIRANPNKPLLNRAFDGRYEPGSIAKIMTAAAALEANVDMAKIFPFTPGTAVILDGKVFRDWENHGKLRSLKEAMDVSSNIALYRIGAALGADALYRMTNRFGFNKPLGMGFELPDGRHFDIQSAVSTAPQIPDTQFALAERACGLGNDFRITPLQAARLAAVIASGGKLMKPQLVREVRSLSGDVLYRMKPEQVEEVMKPTTAAKVAQLMEDAVEGERGIGKKARVEGFSVAGKTGTARTQKNGQLDAWFIAFAPADKPKLAVAVFCDQEGTGMHVAAPIAGAFLREALR